MNFDESKNFELEVRGGGSRPITIADSRSAATFLREQIRSTDVEEFWVIALNSHCHVIGVRMLFRGTVDTCLVHPRDIYRFALRCNSTSIIIGHNHPSGIAYPSDEDVKLSRQLKRAGGLLQIPLLDHVVLGDDEHFSFADSFWPREV